MHDSIENNLSYSALRIKIYLKHESFSKAYANRIKNRKTNNPVSNDMQGEYKRSNNFILRILCCI